MKLASLFSQRGFGKKINSHVVNHSFKFSAFNPRFSTPSFNFKSFDNKNTSLLSPFSFKREFNTFFRNTTFKIQNANNTRGIEDFFETSLHKTGEEDKDKQIIYKGGRAWKAFFLRKKANDDLHKLWFVLLKEQNMLLSERKRLGKFQAKQAGIYSHLRKVKLSMSRIKCVMGERVREYQQFLALKEAKELIQADLPVPKKIATLLPRRELTPEEKFKIKLKRYRRWWRARFKNALRRRRHVNARKLSRRALGSTKINEEEMQSYVQQKLTNYLTRKGHLNNNENDNETKKESN